MLPITFYLWSYKQLIKTMAGYSDLVTKILKNDTLAIAAKKIATDGPNLDLVCMDWAYRLENDIVFQDCQFNPVHIGKSTGSTKYEYESSKDALFDVTLVADCRFPKLYKGKSNSSPSIIVSNSEPLRKIAQVMMRDFGTSIKISDEFKFNFKPCSILTCNQCNVHAGRFQKMGFKLNKHNQPCIQHTLVFDGETIVNRFLSMMEDSYTQNFMAILRLKIDNRYNYTDSNNQKIYRIGGHVSEIIAFDDSKLYSAKTINLGNLAFIDIPKESEEPVCKHNDYESKNADPELEADALPDFSQQVKTKKLVDKEVIEVNYDLNFNDDDKEESPPSKKPKVDESFSFII